MSETFESFQKLLAQKKFREASHLADGQIGDPPDPFWLTQKAVALVRAGEHAQALGAARHALSADPSNPYALATAADSLLGLGRTEESLSHYREALPFPKTAPRARRGILECLSRLNRGEEMISLVAQWALPDEDGTPWKIKALTSLGRREEAVEECTLWLRRRPDYPPALWALTELEIERDGLPAVLERFERTTRISSLPPVYREIYASLCRRAGKPETALKEYEKLRTQGAGSRASRQQAFILAKTGKELEALPLLEELLRGSPTDMYLHSSYEAACRRIGQTERAINFYNSLLTAHPEAKALHGRIKSLRRALERGSAKPQAGEPGS